MISLDALRAALLSKQPYTELDQLVRAELSAGRSTKQVRAELLGLEGVVRSLLDENENADDAMRDTIDALVGFCPAKYAYHDPPLPAGRSDAPDGHPPARTGDTDDPAGR
jgi:hypothetical protein